MNVITRIQELNWEKLATDTLIGNKQSGLPIIGEDVAEVVAEVVLEVVLIGFIGVKEMQPPFRSATPSAL
jgi:hypothetical protein